jgi:hypothetical protein
VTAESAVIVKRFDTTCAWVRDRVFKQFGKGNTEMRPQIASLTPREMIETWAFGALFVAALGWMIFLASQ